MVAQQSFRVAATFPQTEIGADANEIRVFAQGAENLGFSHLVAYDHVVGADIENRPDWNRPYWLDTMFHEPMALLSFLAGVTTTIGLMSGVIILPQRQTVLFAKQAANLDIFCNGRLRLGVGTGWNKVEYDALGMAFEGRGSRLDQQIPLLRRLWTERSLTERSEFEFIDEAGIYPLPLQRPIPIIIGGNATPAMKRAARLGDGWMPYLPAQEAEQQIAGFREEVMRSGRDPVHVQVEVLVFFAAYRMPRRTLDAVVADAEAWRNAGAAAVIIDTMGMGLAGAEAHLDLLAHIADKLGLKRS